MVIHSFTAPLAKSRLTCYHHSGIRRQTDFLFNRGHSNIETTQFVNLKSIKNDLYHKEKKSLHFILIRYSIWLPYLIRSDFHL